MSDNSNADALIALLLFGQNKTSLTTTAVALDGLKPSEREQRNKRQRERYRNLTEEEKARRVRRVPRVATRMPWDSPWYKLLRSENVSGMITVTGYDYEHFHDLLKDFTPIFDANSPYTDAEGFLKSKDPLQQRGRPRLITADACLGMVLYWTRTSCYHWTIAQYFGLTGTCCDLWLRYGKRVLLEVLRNREDAAVKMPSEEKLTQYVGAIQSKYEHLDNVAFVCDGCKVLVQKASDNLMQRSYYNGWKCDHFITNLFVFAPDGTIVAAMLNLCATRVRPQTRSCRFLTSCQ